MKDELKDLIIETISKDEVYTDWYFLYEDLDYNGSVHSIIDSNIDIYNFDLRQWAVEHWEWVDQAKDEGLCSPDADYHAMIQAGQYVALLEEAQQYIKELFNEMNGEYFNIDQTKTA
tara:strand:+ start:907 stop:1257 length:351 start_codon:yes stop_codon:yes gene_type:complete